MPELPADAAVPFETHRVENQPPAFEARDFWAEDVVLRTVVAHHGADAFGPALAAFGRAAGGRLLALSWDANRDRPRLCSHDARGERINLVVFHPNYHAIMADAIEAGVAGLSWQPQAAPAHALARAALAYLHHQAEPGSSCPLTMTHAAVPVLRHEAALAQWADAASALHYDPRDVPMQHKRGITIGMGMTEKQGGSDVRSNRTSAEALDDHRVRLIGHKWFYSAPMSDAHLVLAQEEGAGLGCFLLPRWRDDGSRNAFRLLRLKDKLGDWANASAEVEFTGAEAWRVGTPGRGIATILEMVMWTRLDCMLASAAEMRLALAVAIHHARHRRAFGARLIEQPLMQAVLADLVIEVEAATVFAFEVAAAAAHAASDPVAAAYARIGTAIGKYHVCKRAPGLVNEAQECLGGAGYVEDSLLPRLSRQAPLNAIWEGSGNIQCLDVLRVLGREADAAAAVQRRLDAGSGHDAALDARIARLRPQLRTEAIRDPIAARALVEDLALLLQASALFALRSPLAEAFCRGRLGAEGLRGYGAVVPAAAETLIARALPT